MTIRSDKEDEYIKRELFEFCEDAQIMKQLTASKENIEPLLKWLIDSNLWLVRESGVEAFLSTCHILDKVPQRTCMQLHMTHVPRESQI